MSKNMDTSTIRIPEMENCPEFVEKMVAVLATNPDPTKLAKAIWDWGNEQYQRGYEEGNLGDFYADL